MNKLLSQKSILVVAAHPDDEVLGCGATIARHRGIGDEVHVVVLAEGITSRDKKRNCKQRRADLLQLARSAHKANGVLGASSLTLHNFPDNRMDSVDLLDVIKVVERFVDKYRPEIVYTHHEGDLNIDHKVVHDAVVTACRPVPSQSVKTLLFFEIPSNTEWSTSHKTGYFIPNWFMNVTDTLKIKLKALEAYRSEIHTWPHSRSLEAVEYLARWRGASVGVKAAEAFVLGRNVIALEYEELRIKGPGNVDD